MHNDPITYQSYGKWGELMTKYGGIKWTHPEPKTPFKNCAASEIHKRKKQGAHYQKSMR